MNSKTFLHTLIWAAFTPAALAADWRDYSIGKAGKLQYDAASYHREPGSPRATIETRAVLSEPGHLEDGQTYAYVETLTAVDCDRHESATMELRFVGTNQQVLRKMASGTSESPAFATAQAGNWKRFVISVCQLELQGLGDTSPKRHWIHYLENERGALYFDSASIEPLGPYLKAHVRLYYLGGAEMPSGEKVDLSEANWLIDCRTKRGAVATEKKIRVEGSQGKVVASMQADAKRMPFALPAPGTLPALFTDSLCSGGLTPSR